MRYLLLIAFLLALPACRDSTPLTEEAPVKQPEAAAGTESSDAQPKGFYDLFVKQDSLSYEGYEISKLNKRIIDKEIEEEPVAVSYLVIKRDGKVVDKIEGPHYGLDYSTDFGLFSFLGGDEKQLAVSQTIPRAGRHAIIQFSPDYRVIFDSYDYEVGREEVYVKDIDGDGVYEISLAVVSFYEVFPGLPVAGTPLPMVTFKYDPQEGKYLPANHLFQAHELKEIDRSQINPNTIPLAGMLDLVLDYIYAGREDEAWAFFDREYKSPDKAEVKAKVEAVLKKSPAYKYIRDHSKS